MRIYLDPMEMIKEVERDLFEMGHRYQSKTVQDQNVEADPRFETIELFGYSYCLTNWHDGNLFAMLEHTGGINSEWVLTEAVERVNPDPRNLNPGNAWKKHKDLWGQFIRHGKFSYSYAERWNEQLPYVIDELHRNPHTRQAIMTMYDRHQDMMNWGGLDRVPCSVSYQFYQREGKICCVYNQRSCDFVKFFAADVFFTISLLESVAAQLGKEAGEFIHFLGSLHAFAGDLEGRDIF